MSIPISKFEHQQAAEIDRLSAALEKADKQPAFIGALLTKWDTAAGDTNWNGHIRSIYAACAKDLREAIGSKPALT